MTAELLITEDPRPTVRLVRVLAAPPADVWEALTYRDRLRAWFPCDVVAEAGWQPGADLLFVFPAEELEMTIEGTVLAVDEPRLLAYTWGDETLRFELQETDAGSRLTLLDVVPPPFAARNAAGWEVCLDRLAGLDPAPDAWRGHFSTYADRFGAVLGEQDGPPEDYRGA